MIDTNTSKVAGIDMFPGRFLKHDVDVLTKSVTDIWNVSRSLTKFPRALKQQKLNLFSRKANMLMRQITNQLPTYLLSANTFVGH